MLTRIRTVKPDLFMYEVLFDGEQHYHLPLRLAFIGLLTCCDKAGRFRWKPRRLKCHILPYDDSVSMVAVLEALASWGIVLKYQCNAELYGCIPSWDKHQCVNRREASSELPSPEEGQSVALVPPHEAVEPSSLMNSLHLSGSCKATHPLKTAPSVVSSTDTLNSEKEMVTASEKVSLGTGDLTLDSSTTTKSADNHCNHAHRVVSMQSQISHSKKTQHSAAIPTHTLNSASVRSACKSNEQTTVTRVFEHWQTVMHHPQAQLDPKRVHIIKQALKSGYTPVQLCQAITGCSVTPHNMGDNDRGQRYDGLHVILRDGDQIDRFIRNA